MEGRARKGILSNHGEPNAVRKSRYSGLFTVNDSGAIQTGNTEGAADMEVNTLIEGKEYTLEIECLGETKVTIDEIREGIILYSNDDKSVRKCCTYTMFEERIVGPTVTL